MAPFLRACGSDGLLAGHVLNPKYGDLRAPQGLDAPPERPRHTWLRTLEADLQLLNQGQ